MPRNTVREAAPGPAVNVDRQPHGSVHIQVNGSMALFETAGLDPVFWMHHCNVDRMWETYAKSLGHGYPFQSGAGPAGAAKTSWTKQKFNFLRPDASVKAWTALHVNTEESNRQSHAMAAIARLRDGVSA